MAFKISFIGMVASLLAATQAAEEYPSLPTMKCTSSGGCVQQNTSVVLDKDSKLASAVGGSRSAADYAAMGVSTSGNALTLYHYVKGASASPRVYLLGADNHYVLMSLLNQELSVDVDLSNLPCGENGAFYLSEMAADGGGTGGAGAGDGYCDAQCQGFCCNEMDILEANSQATAMTPHPCKSGTCDKGGCGYNPYASGQHNYWGPGKTVDTSKVFTVVTQFTASGGRLTQITRKYIQNGRQISGGGTISSCGSEGSTGGLTGMGQALGRGSTFSLPSCVLFVLANNLPQWFWQCPSGMILRSKWLGLMLELMVLVQVVRVVLRIFSLSILILGLSFPIFDGVILDRLPSKWVELLINMRGAGLFWCAFKKFIWANFHGSAVIFLTEALQTGRLPFLSLLSRRWMEIFLMQLFFSFFILMLVVYIRDLCIYLLVHFEHI